MDVFIGLRPSIHSWLKFQPEDEGDDVPAPESEGWNFNQDLDERS